MNILRTRGKLYDMNRIKDINLKLEDNDYIYASDSKGFYNIGNIIKVYVDKEDFPIVRRYGWYISNKGYVYTMIENHTIFIHRMIMKCNDTNVVIDHNDGNKLNNRKSNLIEMTNEENLYKAWKVQNLYNTNKKVAMYDKYDNDYLEPLKIFNSQKEAALYLTGGCIGQGSISNACSGKRKSALGYRWRYIT